MVEFSYFFGIDQTGAAFAGGKRAKPLKVCLAKKVKKGWTVHTQNSKGGALTLEGVTPSALKAMLDPFEVDWPNHQIAIIADCVLGMPKDHWPNIKESDPSKKLWKLFHKTVNHNVNGSIFGMQVSESFFKQFHNQSKSFSKRHCEEISGSNSIFTTRPFQKNIQTGSFRIWRDLVTESRAPWLNIWPFNSEKSFDSKSAWLFEGYPSLFWQQYLEIPRRNSKLLIQALKSPTLNRMVEFDVFSQIESDPDLCDAAVLALGGILLQNQKRLMTPFLNFWETPIVSTEGWISGLSKEKKVPVVFSHRQK